MNLVQKELLFTKGKRKYLFCADARGAEPLYILVNQAIEEKVPFDFLVFEHESDDFLNLWLNQQKMGTYLYLSGDWEFVNRLKNLAFEAGFSDHEMQMNILGPITKKLICSKCHGVNDVEDDPNITCEHCGIELEVSSHYSRLLEAYLGYTSIKQSFGHNGGA
ncbi:MAG: dimethylamine monooxygenase subunit DmmA family protein [Mesobacillus sp.]|uniref:dimethylamine monooxygenase subunit DmmA family protein n=1 Tax=Mesobacillus sp. TaxID=2675271 RepID=UPI003C4DE391